MPRPFGVHFLWNTGDNLGQHYRKVEEKIGPDEEMD